MGVASEHSCASSLLCQLAGVLHQLVPALQKWPEEGLHVIMHLQGPSMFGSLHPAASLLWVQGLKLKTRLKYIFLDACARANPNVLR